MGMGGGGGGSSQPADPKAQQRKDYQDQRKRLAAKGEDGKNLYWKHQDRWDSPTGSHGRILVSEQELENPDAPLLSDQPEPSGQQTRILR